MEKLRGLWQDFVSLFAISFWVYALFATVGSILLALICVPHPLALLYLGLMAVLLVIPLNTATPKIMQRFIRFSVIEGIKYHNLSLHIEDPEALKPGRPYVVGYEPHSALPVALPLVFCEESPLVPPALRSVKVLATSACFYCPVVRHLWWWLGGRPATAAVMRVMLSKGDTALVCPGGVRECTYMRKGREAVFLTSRTGFVRIAMQYGAPLVPVFVFGQTDAYSWVKLGPPFFPQGLTQQIARSIGFLPLLMSGVWGTPVPHKIRMTTVIGKLINVPKRENPSEEEVQRYLDAFIGEMKRIFERHKAAVGYPDLELLVI